MGVDHSRFHTFVPQQFLNCTDIVPIFQQMGGKRVPETMAGDPFGHPRQLNRFLDCLLHTPLIDMMTANDPRAGVARQMGSRKNLLPTPVTISIGILAIQCIR